MSTRTTAPHRPDRLAAPVRVVAPVLALVVASALTACAGASPSSAASGTPGSSSAAPSASSASASASASSTGSSSFTLLPESALTAMAPLTYATAAGADAGMAAQGAKPAVNAVFSGGISRELTYQGKTVGGVELYRFGTTVPADARAKFVTLMVQSFAQVTPTPGTLAGTPVEVADQARGTTVTVVGWTQGDDVVLVWAQGVPAVQQIATQYISQSAKG